MIVADRRLLAVAAVLWLGAVVLAPTTSGAGAALSGHALADLIGSHAGLPGVPRWLGPAWYAMPLAAAVVLVTLGAEGRRAARTRHAAALTAGVVGVAFLVLVTHLQVTRFGLGAWCEIAGAALVPSAFAISGRDHVL
jgi:hypothetical protein